MRTREGSIQAENSSRYKSVENVMCIGKNEYFDGKVKLERWEGDNKNFPIVNDYTPAYPDHLV